MTFQTVSGVTSCVCPSGYSTTGIASIGPQSCVLTAQATSSLNTETAAAVVVYSDLATTVNSLTMLHYYTYASTRCAFYGGTQDNVHSILFI